MAIQSNFPAIKPSLLLDFANTKTLDPRITFTRASTATYYDGVTTAMAEQNLFTYSQDFDNAAWGKVASSVTANTTVAPDGNTTADTLTADGTTAVHNILQAVSVSATGRVVSVYLKAGTNNFAQIYFDADANPYANFDLSGGTVGTVGSTATASIVSVGSGWYRCIVSTTSTTATNFHINIVTASTATRAESNSLATTLIMWGAQSETRQTVTAYTATTTQAITNYIPKLQSAASGVARFDNNPTTGESLGLLIEEQRTNLITYSEQFDNAAWTKYGSLGVSSNAVVAPDGTLTGDNTVPPASTGTFGIGQTFTKATSSITYTVSGFSKVAGYDFLIFRIDSGGANGVKGAFNIATSTVSTAFTTNGSGFTFVGSSLTSIGNGWVRWSVTFTSDATNTLRLIVYVSNATGDGFSVPSYTANGYSGIYIWGAQLEAGSFATSYIPTVASQVTRSADAASMTGTNFSSWYNQGAGTIFVDYVGNSANPTANNQGIYHFGPGGYAGTNSNVAIINAAGMTTAINLTGTLSSLTATPRAVTGRLATSYSPTTLSSVVNNNTVATTTVGPALGGITSVNFGTTPSPIPSMNGSIKKFAYYPFAVTSAQLQALTS